MNNLHMVLPKSEKTLSEKDIMINFEESQQELETSIVKAMQLVGQKVSPEEHASKYEVGSNTHFRPASYQESNQSAAFLSDSLQLRSQLSPMWKIAHTSCQFLTFLIIFFYHY